MKFTTHQCLVLKLRMSGAVPLLPYALMAWTSKPVFFLLCVGAVIVFLLLLLAFFEFYADCCRKSPVYHFFPQSSIFNLLRALFIPCSD
jgi:Na+/serine symporter